MSVRARATQIEAEAMERVLLVLTPVPHPIHHIAVSTGLSDREVQAAVEIIRREGVAPVCGGGDGLWMAQDDAEYAANIDRRRRRAVRQLVNVRGERKLLRRLRQPMTLGF